MPVRSLSCHDLAFDVGECGISAGVQMMMSCLSPTDPSHNLIIYLWVFLFWPGCLCLGANWYTSSVESLPTSIFVSSMGLLLCHFATHPSRWNLGIAIYLPTSYSHNFGMNLSEICSILPLVQISCRFHMQKSLFVFRFFDFPRLGERAAEFVCTRISKQWWKSMVTSERRKRTWQQCSSVFWGALQNLCTVHCASFLAKQRWNAISVLASASVLSSVFLALQRLRVQLAGGQFTVSSPWSSDIFARICTQHRAGCHCINKLTGASIAWRGYFVPREGRR